MTKGNVLVGVDPTTKRLIQFLPDPNYSLQLKSIVDKGGGVGSINLKDQESYIIFTRWMPKNQTYLVLEVPQYFVYNQVTLLDPYNLLLLVIFLVITSAVVYTGAARIITPIVQLTNQAKKFAEGDLTQRSKIDRRDEIGLLARSFNTMGDQLSALYRSLESRVEDRTRQIRIATDIAQTAVAGTNREDIVRAAAELVVEKFGYSFASILLLDESGKQIILQSTSDSQDKAHLVRSFKVSITEESLISQVINQNEAEIIEVSADGAGGQPGLVQPGTLSEMVVPIASGKQVIGAMDIQSTQAYAFDSNIVHVFQTLAYQIAAGILKLQLFEFD